MYRTASTLGLILVPGKRNRVAGGGNNVPTARPLRKFKPPQLPVTTPALKTGFAPRLPNETRPGEKTNLKEREKKKFGPQGGTQSEKELLATSEM